MMESEKKNLEAFMAISKHTENERERIKKKKKRDRLARVISLAYKIEYTPRCIRLNHFN